MNKQFEIADYYETLRVTPKGKYLLTIGANGEKTKSLTFEEAREWYKKRYSLRGWQRVMKHVEAWKEDLQ